MSTAPRRFLPVLALAAALVAVPVAVSLVAVVTSLPGTRQAAMRPPARRAYAPHVPSRPPRPTLGERAATIALREVGVPYRWGGASPTSGFDCSGLVYWVYERLGIDLPHSSYALYDVGRRVSRSRMRPGDVLFFDGLGHVGLYVGGGRMVHAPHSGLDVEVVSLARSSYGRSLVAARRIAAWQRSR